MSKIAMLKEVLTVLEGIEEINEAMDIIIPVVQNSGAKLRPIFEDLTDFGCAMNTRAFNIYLENGFSRKEAMQFCLSTKIAMQEFAKKSKS